MSRKTTKARATEARQPQDATSAVQPIALTRAQAAKALGISVPSLDRLHAQGIGPKCVFFGASRRYLPASIVAWAKAREVDPSQMPRRPAGELTPEQKEEFAVDMSRWRSGRRKAEPVEA